MSEPIIELAETIQTASIKRDPSPRHDLNPSTAASRKIPVQLHDFSPDPSDVLSDVEEDEVPLSALRPTPRKHQMPPLPDLRFEQSYLASIQNAESWQGVAYITIRDQVLQKSRRRTSTMLNLTIGLYASCPRRGMDTCRGWLEILEQGCTIQWADCGSSHQEMVVGSQ